MKPLKSERLYIFRKPDKHIFDLATTVPLMTFVLEMLTALKERYCSKF